MGIVKKAPVLDGIDSHLPVISEYYLILHNMRYFTVTPFWGDWSFWNRRIWKGEIVIVFTNDSITISDIEVGENTNMSNFCVFYVSGQLSD